MKHRQDTPAGVTVHVKSKNVVLNPDLHAQIVSKMGRLDKYHDQLHDLEVELSNEKTRAAEHQNRAEVTTRISGRTIRVTSADADMQAAIDACIDKLYRQLNRQKERLKAHHGARFEGARSLDPRLEPPSTETDESHELREPVVHVEQLQLEPQFEDEAMEEMNRQGHAFHLFLNARNEHLNVLYRRQDGSFGLIEPRTR